MSDCVQSLDVLHYVNAMWWNDLKKSEQKPNIRWMKNDQNVCSSIHCAVDTKQKTSADYLKTKQIKKHITTKRSNWKPKIYVFVVFDIVYQLFHHYQLHPPVSGPLQPLSALGQHFPHRSDFHQSVIIILISQKLCFYFHIINLSNSNNSFSSLKISK